MTQPSTKENGLSHFPTERPWADGDLRHGGLRNRRAAVSTAPRDIELKVVELAARSARAIGVRMAGCREYGANVRSWGGQVVAT